MSSDAKSERTEEDLAQLEGRVDELIRAVARLKNENISLRSRQEDLMSERSALIDKTEQAKSRLEAMIGRLKSMENKQ